MMTLVFLRTMISFEMTKRRREVTLEMRVRMAQSHLGRGGDLMKCVCNSETSQNCVDFAL